MSSSPSLERATTADELMRAASTARYLAWFDRMQWLAMKWRVRLGMKIVGRSYLDAVSRLWLIRERAMTAITRDGHVILADCPALAEALYADIPGEWQVTTTLTRVDHSARTVSPAQDDRNGR